MDNSSEFFDVPSASSMTGPSSLELVRTGLSGYSEIWRIDRGGRFRALKCLKKEFRGDPMYERLLLKEFEIGYSLSHGNICEYYSFGQDPELGNHIEMEWVDGRTLEEFIAEGKCDRIVYDKIVGEICSALSYMHAKQVLHRDLKPSNILVTYNGNNVKLIDFGLSDTDSSSVLKTPAGTAVYAAPEVRSGGKASVQSDLYSLGMVMSLFPVRRYSGIVRKLCSLKPEARYSSVGEVQKALKSNRLFIIGIIIIFLIVLLALALALQKFSRPVPEVSSPVPEPVEGSLPEVSSPVPESVEGPAPAVTDTVKSVTALKAKKTQPKTSTDTNLIDELFRQATELFE